MNVKCFAFTRTPTVRRYLRRYAGDSTCLLNGYHNAMEPFEDVDRPEGDDTVLSTPEPPYDPLLWPRTCSCGYVFLDEDSHQIFEDPLYRREDTGEIVSLRNAPPGAMYFADWYDDIVGHKGDDGRSLVVILPNGNPWQIDTQARNCTMPDDHAQLRHHCWVRHGEVPNVTVDKRGATCAAGGGSIQSGDWHGFLIGGELVAC